MNLSVPFTPPWRPTHPGFHESDRMPLDTPDPEALNQARLSAKLRKLRAERVQMLERFGENQRLRQAELAATESGREQGYSVGWSEGSRFGLLAGATAGLLVGVLVGALIVRAAPSVLHTAAGWFA